MQSMKSTIILGLLKCNTRGHWGRRKVSKSLGLWRPAWRPGPRGLREDSEVGMLGGFVFPKLPYPKQPLYDLDLCISP